MSLMWSHLQRLQALSGINSAGKQNLRLWPAQALNKTNTKAFLKVYSLCDQVFTETLCFDPVSVPAVITSVCDRVSSCLVYIFIFDMSISLNLSVQTSIKIKVFRKISKRTDAVCHFQEELCINTLIKQRWQSWLLALVEVCLRLPKLSTAHTCVFWMTIYVVFTSKSPFEELFLWTRNNLISQSIIFEGFVIYIHIEVWEFDLFIGFETCSFKVVG